jgi:LacI family transcriptional regulator
VLIVLDCAAAWSRGVLRGFSRVAHEQGWSLFHYRRLASVELLANEVAPAAAVVGPSALEPWPPQLQGCIKVAVNADRRAEGIASVGLDGAKAAELAVSHLQARGFRNLTTFRFDHWGALRERHFREVAAQRGARLEPGWWSDAAVPSSKEERPAAIMQWLLSLQKPCGIFALCDEWTRCLARYARAAQLRVPEDVALLGVDNDLFECEVESPALSSIAVSWQSLGEAAARLVQQGLRGTPPDAQNVLIPPLEVVVRRSSDVLAIEDPLVAAAVRWIHANFSSRMTVPAVARAVRSARQRLERRFRKSLGRTVLEEVRRTRVEAARRLLSTTQLPLVEVARRCGFTTAALLSVAFRRELGISPGAYRKRARSLLLEAED